MAPKKKAKVATLKPRVPVETIRHKKDRRVNIPTRELRDFVAEEEASPKTKVFEGLLYARDPSLDPQLVWKGKDEQDRRPLEIPVLPIYIHEKIHPQAIIENVRSEARKDEPSQLPTLFSDFNGISFEEMVDFYHHSQNWSNRMILGDSLVVMTSLAEKEGLKGRVQTIYIDPPYGIKFASNWQVSTRKRDVKDGKVDDLTRQPEQIRAFRDTWELGIHSYLSYLRDRLVVARELLTETGSVFVQIGDENVHLVRCLLDEVFGVAAFRAQITYRTSVPLTSSGLAGIGDYILWYSKNPEGTKHRDLFSVRAAGEGTVFSSLDLGDGSRRPMLPEEREDPTARPKGSRVFGTDNLVSSGYTATCTFQIEFNGRVFSPTSGKSWKTNEKGIEALRRSDRLWASGKTLRYIFFVDDYPVMKLSNIWMDTKGETEKSYVVQTTTKAVERCLLMTTDPGDLVLDPTCGSGTTAYVAEQWGRRWITIDTSRVALALARTRLMAARYPYYLLSDSPEGLMKEAELTGTVPPSPLPRTEGDVRKGFVYKRVPHVTLKSIANNEEIDVIWEKYHAEMEPIRAQLNATLKKSWEEWEIPREADEEWPKTALDLHESWWKLRRGRQTEIDSSIAKRATPETLFDQPYEDSKKIRVTGPFTVESLSPHRVLDADPERPASEKSGDSAAENPDFATMILENLKKAGVQNTIKADRLVFERLDPWPGRWIQAAGEFSDKGGTTRRVAVSLGPEHGTVGSEQVKEAAKEALEGRGFDILVVCGFAFDATAGETAKEFKPKQPDEKDRRFAVAYGRKQYGKLPVILARMNPDLTMGDEVLKKTGAGNLFMAFGEPDLKIDIRKDGKITVTVRGVDIYDPTTGQIRSSSPDDIACWFLDTDYNGESFFVRQAYFGGGNDPYEKLRRALRAEVDEEAWSALYSMTSIPFEPPKTGKIAVKVINHYGDEVLEVRTVR
jgi:adenine-specific DNA-methyltransferase